MSYFRPAVRRSHLPCIAFRLVEAQSAVTEVPCASMTLYDPEGFQAGNAPIVSH